MPPKKKAAEAPKRSIEDIRKQYEPRQEAMRNEIAALKQSIELVSVRRHSTVIDLELARDRNVLTEGRLESKREVLENAMANQRKRIEDATEKTQEIKSTAHIKNIRVQMLSKERDEYAANRKVPEAVLKSEQLKKDLSAFFSSNPQVTSLIEEREDATRKAVEHEEALSVYKTTMDKVSTLPIGSLLVDIVAAGNKEDRKSSTVSTLAAKSITATKQQESSMSGQGLPAPYVDPAVVAALDEDIQRFSAELAERSLRLNAIRRTEAMIKLVEKQVEASHSAKRHLESRTNNIAPSATPSAVVGKEVGEASNAKAKAPLQLTYIHGNSSFDYNGGLPASMAFGLEGTPLPSAPSPCDELAQVIQLRCGFALCQEHKLSRSTNNVSCVIRHAVKRAMTSPSSPHAMPLVIIEGYVKTRSMPSTRSTGGPSTSSTEELVVMCDPLSDVNNLQQVVPLNDLLCEVFTAAPTGWDQGTIILELAPADSTTQGLAIMANRGGYLRNADANGNSATGSSIVFQYHKFPSVVEETIKAASASTSKQPKLLAGKVGNSHCGLLASLVTYIIRDSATPAAAVSSCAIIEALKGALDNPSAHSLFAGIGRVLRPAQQRSEVATILCIPPQLVRQAARNPHRTLFGPQQQNTVAGRLLVLSPPATGKLGDPRPWLCVARAEGNSTVFERIRRQAKERELAARKKVNNGVEDRSQSTFSASVAAPFSPSEPNSEFFLPVIIAQAATALELQHRLTVEICSHEERLMLLRTSIHASQKLATSDVNTNAMPPPSPASLVTWMSKRALEDTNQQVAQMQQQHRLATNEGGADAARSEAPAPSSAVRAKLLASVSSARNRSALEIHVSGAALSEPLSGLIRIILVRKDVSALASVAGMALFDNTTALAGLVEQLFNSTVRQPLLRSQAIASEASVVMECNFVEEPLQNRPSAPKAVASSALPSSLSGGVYVLKGTIPITVDEVARDVLLTDFLAALSAACRDPKPPSEDYIDLQPLNSRTQSSSSTASPTAAPITHIACEQPWVFLNQVTITARDGLCKSLVQQCLRGSIVFTEWVNEKEYADRCEALKQIKTEARERALKALEVRREEKEKRIAAIKAEMPQGHDASPKADDIHRGSISFSAKDVSFVGADASRLDLSRPQSAAGGLVKPAPTSVTAQPSPRNPTASSAAIAGKSPNDHNDSMDNEVRSIIIAAPEADKRYDADDFED